MSPSPCLTEDNAMSDRRRTSGPDERIGFTLLELIIVLVIMGVVGGMAIPHLRPSGYRADAAAQQIRSVVQTAQRTSLTRQYDVIVSVDTIKFGLRIAEDANNDGIIEAGEWKFWRPEGDFNRFAVPSVGVNGVVTTSVVGSTLKTVDGYPSIIFHRDGSASSDAEIYVVSSYKGRADWRAITISRSTSRTELYRLSGNSTTAKWMTIAQ
jgi:prepilin-type N-terminal cleavage/methylation domain-containing protein